VVECDLAKVEVAGSNPVSRSRILKPRNRRGLFVLASLFRITNRFRTGELVSSNVFVYFLVIHPAR
jgi:hypothetical protein